MRTLGKRVKGNLSRVQIPHPPPFLPPEGESEMNSYVTICGIFAEANADFMGRYKHSADNLEIKEKAAPVRITWAAF